MPDASEEFLTVAEIAAILKLNQMTIRNWLHPTLWLAPPLETGAAAVDLVELRSAVAGLCDGREGLLGVHA